MAFNQRETSLVKGMLARGDKQHDIASFFGVNGGRVAEVSTGDCDYPSAAPAPEEELPPKPPYPSPYQTLRVKKMVEDLARKIGKTADPAAAKKLAVGELWKISDAMK